MPTVPPTAVRPVPNAPAGKTLTYIDPNSLHPVQGLAPPTPAPPPPVDVFTAAETAINAIGDASNFIESLDNTPAGLQLTLAGTGALAARSTELVVPGFKVADLGPKFTIGSEIDGANPAHDFLALHFT